MQKILVLEDDEKLNQILCTYLAKNQYQPAGCCRAEAAFDKLSEEDYSLIISDIMLPGNINGFEFVKTVRETNPVIPILLVTALDDLPSKVKGFHSGVDDYMVKPIDMDEMLLRVEALLRRARINNENRLEAGDLVLLKDELSAYVGGREVPLLPREFSILYRLLSHPRKVFTRSELLDEYGGTDSETGLRSVDVYIARLRNKFADCKSFEIVTVHGFGYKAVLL